MNTRKHISKPKVVSIASALPPREALVLVRSHRAMNLAALAELIRDDQQLCSFVIANACRQFGWPSLRIEDAIVLLGVRHLCALLARPVRRGGSASRPRRSSCLDNNAPSANLHLLDRFQGKQL